MPRYSNRVVECDKCTGSFDFRSDHAADFGSQRVTRVLHGVKVVITTGLRSWNTQNLCVACIVEILTEGRWSPSVQNNNDLMHTVTYLPEQEWCAAILGNYIQKSNKLWNSKR